MTVDPFRLAIALVPVAAYVLLLGVINARRRPFMTSGGSDLAALGVATSGLMFVGPLELFRPMAATRELGNYIWPMLLMFYWLWLVLVVLLSRPRLVVYNITMEELHPVLAKKHGIADGDWVTAESRRGSLTVRCQVVTTIRPDVVFVPYHWAGEKSVNLATIAAQDPISKIPEYKVSAVRIERVRPGGAVQDARDLALQTGNAP